MAWTSPMTAVAADLFTASEYNVNVRDNFLEMAASINKDLATSRGGFFSVEASNRLKQRFPGTNSVNVEHNIKIYATSFQDCQSAGPMITVKTGSRALVCISAEMKNANNNAQASASFEISGATKRNASDNWRITHDGIDAQKWSRQSVSSLQTGLTPGLNTFRMKYRTGNLGPVYYRRREITVIPL